MTGIFFGFILGAFAVFLSRRLVDRGRGEPEIMPGLSFDDLHRVVEGLAQSAYAVVDLQGKTRFCSIHFSDLVGLGPGCGALVGRPFEECFLGPNREAALELLLGEVDAQTGLDLTIEAGGQTRVIRLAKRALYGRGERIGAAVLAVDQTDTAATIAALGEIKTHFEEMLHVSSHILYRFNLETDRFEYLGGRSLQSLGYDPDSVGKLGLSDLGRRIHPDDLPWINDKLKAAAQEAVGDRFDVEFEYRGFDGRGGECVFRDNRTVLLNPDKTPRAFIGSAVDVTEFRTVERKLSESLDFIEAIQRRAGLVFYQFDAKADRFSSLSPQIETLLGWTAEEYGGFSLAKILSLSPPDDVAAAALELDRALDQRTGNRFPLLQQKRLRHKDGRYVWIEDDCEIEVDGDGEFVRISGVFRDVSARVEAERALMDNQARLALLLDSMPVLVLSWGRDKRLRFWNLECERVTGYSSAEILGDPLSLHKLYPEPGRLDALAAEYLTLGEAFRDFEVPMTCKDGSMRTIAWSRVPFSRPGEEAAGWVVGVDVTAKNEARAELAQAAARFKAVLDHAPLILFVKDATGRYTLINRRGAELAGLAEDDFIGRLDEEVFPATVAQHFIHAGAKVVESGKTLTEELRLPHPQGDVILLATIFPIPGPGGAPIAVGGAALDVTEEKRLMDEAVKAGRLASIGELAAGVAHEINNPLNGVINYAEILRDEICAGHSELPARIIKEAERIGWIAKSLLSLSGGGAKSEPVVLAEALADCLALLRKRIEASKILVELNLGEVGERIVPSGQEVRQVLLNILSNALHSLDARRKPGDPKKRLVLTAGLFHRESTVCVRFEALDYGLGLGPGLAARVFDPFFTTKPKNEGAGLGLSISLRIAQSLGGRLYLVGEENGYAKAVLELPLHHSHRTETDAAPNLS